jgi:FHS family L-fucose permease-like MFS transporter
MNVVEPDRDSVGAPVRFSRDLQAFVFSLFFVFGGITSLNDVIIPKLKSLFTLSNGEAMLVQSAFFGAYFFLSLPAAALVRKIGYMQSAAVGLLTMTAGCLLFVPASEYGLFLLFLVALFVLAAGITTVQVVANPLISMLGPRATTSSRLTFAQAFNSVGTTVFPYVGSAMILGSLATLDPATLSGAALSTFRTVETRVIVHAYLGLGLALGLLALVVWVRRTGLIESAPSVTPIASAFNLLRRPRFAFGAACIFLYVGAEVAIGSSIVIYLMQPTVLATTAVDAGKYYVPLYWGGAMVGRFIGGFLLRAFAPGLVLAAAAAVAVALLLTSAATTGAVCAWSLLAIGLFNSIMFPTIFSLASDGLGTRAAEGSGVMCVAIVGGAIIPPLTGHTADLWGWKTALLVPAACYCCILGYGWYTRRPARS